MVVGVSDISMYIFYMCPVLEQGCPVWGLVIKEGRGKTANREQLWPLNEVSTRG
jgi:hypothetical protein